jgi:hypothetical protein
MTGSREPQRQQEPRGVPAAEARPVGQPCAEGRDAQLGLAPQLRDSRCSPIAVHICLRCVRRKQTDFTDLKAKDAFSLFQPPLVLQLQVRLRIISDEMRAGPPASPHPEEIHWLCMAALASYVVPCHGYSRRPQHLLVNFRRPWPIASPNDAFGTARFLQHQVPMPLLLIRSQKAAQRAIVMSALHSYRILRRFLSLASQLMLLRPFPDSNCCDGDILTDGQ